MHWTAQASGGGWLPSHAKWQADDIDGVTYVSGAERVAPGTFVEVHLDEVVEDVDFAASLTRVFSAPPPPVRAARTLRVLGSVGSFGR